MRNLSLQEVIEPKNQSIARSSYRADPKVGRSTERASETVFSLATFSSTFPQQYIQRIIAQAVARTYALDWNPRVVRQHKQSVGGTLTFIDYAVPCFELAKDLKLTPVAVASEIARNIEIYATGSEDMKIEAVAGYINVQIGSNLLAESANQTLNWLHEPRSLSPVDDVTYNFIALATSLGNGKDDGNHLTDEVYRFVGELFSLLGHSTHMTYLVDDTLAEAFHELDEKGLQPAEYRQVRHDLQNGTSYEGWRAEKRQQRQELAGNTNYEYEDVFASDITEEVHIYLNTLDATQGFYHDATSLATYYAEGDIVVALRSAEGTLYSYAYLLYRLDFFQRGSHAQAHHNVVVLPAKDVVTMKVLVMAAQLSPDEIVYVDPRTLQADVTEIDSTIASLTDYFSTMATILTTLPLETTKSRQAALTIIDMPYALSELAKTTQLPAIADCINQATETVADLR